jgi:hypothetical protein
MTAKAKRFAEGTEVPVSRSRAEIEKLLKERNATNRLPIEIEAPEGATWAVVQFDLADRRIRFRVLVPGIKHFMGKEAQLERAERRHAQFEREVWRALFLVIKAKFVNVDAGIESMEEAFLAQTMTPDGRTFAEHALPALSKALASGKPPLLMLGPGGTS